MSIKRVSLEELAKSKGRTTKEELDKISDVQIAESVLQDVDSSIPTESELKEFGKPKKRNIDHEEES
jgi:hypothetical protein